MPPTKTLFDIQSEKHKEVLATATLAGANLKK